MIIVQKLEIDITINYCRINNENIVIEYHLGVLLLYSYILL